jgi:hypothetical protein
MIIRKLEQITSEHILDSFSLQSEPLATSFFCLTFSWLYYFYCYSTEKTNISNLPSTPTDDILVANGLCILIFVYSQLMVAADNTGKMMAGAKARPVTCCRMCFRVVFCNSCNCPRCVGCCGAASPKPKNGRNGRYGQGVEMSTVDKLGQVERIDSENLRQVDLLAVLDRPDSFFVFRQFWYVSCPCFCSFVFIVLAHLLSLTIFYVVQ